jgi:hypothetical protein
MQTELSSPLLYVTQWLWEHVTTALPPWRNTWQVKSTEDRVDAINYKSKFRLETGEIVDHTGWWNNAIFCFKNPPYLSEYGHTTSNFTGPPTSAKSFDQLVKRLSCVNKTIPACQVFVRYWHAEQRPYHSYVLPLCPSYPGTTTACLIWAAGPCGGEGWLAARCTHALPCSITRTKTHPTYSNASNGTNRSSGSKFSAKPYVKEASVGLQAK